MCLAISELCFCLLLLRILVDLDLDGILADSFCVLFSQLRITHL